MDHNKNNNNNNKEKQKFQVPLLWRIHNPQLPTENSLRIAERRLKILIKHAKRLNKLNEITEQVENLIQKGYARKLTSLDMINPPPKTFYLPIFISEQKGKRIMFGIVT